MAIKIKRDVNPMAAAYGSKIGGKGKRQTEDAKILASLQRNGGGMGGGGGGGARASAPSSLISAPSGGGGAPLGSLGGVVTPSAVAPRGNSGGGVSGVSSPGGRKKGYLGSTSARATMTDADYEGYTFTKAGSVKNPVYELEDTSGKVVRTYSQAQYDFMQKRGHSNSTMDRLDSAAFFRSQGGKTATERAEDIREEERDFRAGEADKTRKFNAEEGEKDRTFKAEQAQEDRDYRTEQERLRREARQKELEDERKWKEEQARQEEMRRLQNASWEEQGFDAEQRMNLRELHRKRNSIAEDPKLRDNQTERDAALKDIDDQISKIKPINPPKSKQDAFTDSIVTDATTGIRYRQDGRGNWIPMETTQPKSMSPQEIWASAFVAPDGTRWISDGRGGITPLTDPNAKADAMSKNKRTEYILGRVKELLAPDINGNDSKFTPKTAAERAAEEYDAVSGGGAAPASTSKPIGTDKEGNPIHPLPADEEKKNKWGSFAR